LNHKNNCKFCYQSCEGASNSEFSKGAEEGAGTEVLGGRAGGVFKQLIIDKYYSCQELMISILLERSFASPAHHTYPYHNSQWATSKRSSKDFIGLNQRPHLLLSAHVWRS